MRDDTSKSNRIPIQEKDNIPRSDTIKGEYHLLRQIRGILDEINILQPIFDEQHSMTVRLLRLVSSKDKPSLPLPYLGNTGAESCGLSNPGSSSPNFSSSRSSSGPKGCDRVASPSADNGNGSGGMQNDGVNRRQVANDQDEWPVWEDLTAADKSEIIKKRIEWLDKDAKRVLNSVRYSYLTSSILQTCADTLSDRYPP